MSINANHRYPGRARFACGACLVLAGLLPSNSSAQPARERRPLNVEQADQLRRDLREMIALARDRVFPALVNIEVITVRYYGGKERKGRAVGVCPL